MMTICGTCGNGFEPTHDHTLSTICKKCLEVGNEKASLLSKGKGTAPPAVPPMPRVIWEGKHFINGQLYDSRGVISWKPDGQRTDITFEYAKTKDAMGVTTWAMIGVIPEQFIKDAVSIMDTALTPNRIKTPPKT